MRFGYAARLAAERDAEDDVAVRQVAGVVRVEPLGGTPAAGIPFTATPPHSISSSRISDVTPRGKNAANRGSIWLYH